jgi:phosphotransferase system, enzyme I, PtsP
MVSSEPALRIIMRSLREIMAKPGDAETRLDKIVHQIAGVMVADVCSIYLRRQDGSLELFATEGLKHSAVHATRLKRGEGLVGRAAEFNVTVNEPDAPKHPAFSYRPETGEELYHSLLAVPIRRSGQALGVLVVQNRTAKVYSEEDVEVLESTAMVVAENLVSGLVSGDEQGIELSDALAGVVQGEAISDGIALGHVVFHEPRIVVHKLMSNDPVEELSRLQFALKELRRTLDEMLAHEHLASSGDHRDVLEAYRMFAHDSGWVRRLEEAVQDGLTAEAAVERVLNATRARMLRQSDPFWNERQRDLDDLSDRLLRTLAGRGIGGQKSDELPPDTILVARTMGPAELLDYDRNKLRGLVVEDGSSQSHVAIVAKALGIAGVGQAIGVVDKVSPGDAVIVDSESGQVHLRPSEGVIASYSDKVRFRAKRQQRYDSLKSKPAITRDGVEIALQINAGLLVDMPHLEESGADGVGLFRTELFFMLSETFPRPKQQAAAYKAVLERANGKPVIFRTLDIGGDKELPYMRHVVEENPAIGWRAIRMSLDRSAMFRSQVRAFLHAGIGKDLNIMVPMVSTVDELRQARKWVDKETERLRLLDRGMPTSIKVGAMIEVPSLLLVLDELLQEADFVSVGSNDLLQFLYAADRTNARVASRYSALSLAPLRALKSISEAANRNEVPLTVCGEMAGRPLEAMVLIALGFRTLSMSPAAIGPIKEMILSLNADDLKRELDGWLSAREEDLRPRVRAFAEANKIAV